MATTTQYLEQLQADKQTLVDNLVAKGVEASSAETFTSLVPKVADIQAGDISEYFEETVSSGTNTVSGWLNAVKKLPALSNTGANCSYMYANYKGAELDLSKMNFSIITTTAGMFNQCSNLTRLDLSSWAGTISVATNMFARCVNLTYLDLKNLKTASGTSIGSMFLYCGKLEYLDIRNMTLSLCSGSGVFTDVPANCEIIVKDDTEKEWILSQRSDFTNVKTVAELV